MTDKPRLAEIGRPGIGGEFLTVHPTQHDRYELRRWRRVNSARDESRQLNVRDVPADTMIYDLLSAIEGVVEHALANDVYLHFDSHDLTGDRPSLRERFAALAEGRVGNDLIKGRWG